MYDDVEKYESEGVIKGYDVHKIILNDQRY